MVNVCPAVGFNGFPLTPMITAELYFLIVFSSFRIAGFPSLKLNVPPRFV